jgi:hypothetical protein
MTYKKLLLLSISKFNAHLSILLKNISALEKMIFVGSNADSTLLRHAYTTHPYCSTLVTNAFTSYNFTRTFEIPRSLQFDLTAYNVLFDLLIRSYSKTSGFLLQFDNFKPKYLNSFTVSISFSFTIRVSTQFIYIALVFLAFICKSFSVQNYTKQFMSSYNSTGSGASRTRSSAKASKNIYNDAIVYARRLVPLILCVL